jgi:CDP-diacylglycerol--serine O-phosphatidyltransferase
MLRLSVLRKRRDRMKHYKLFIANGITLLNALFGFIAIIKAIEGDVLVSAYCILFAALLDGCDGRIARALGSTSAFGSELDSLADAVSFCGAPMVLMYQWLPKEIHFMTVLLLGLYLCAGLWRLAKFNVITKESTQFIGLPTTIAALTLALFVVYQPWLLCHCTHFITVPLLITLIMCLGYLMVSSITFTKLNRYCARARWEKLLVIFAGIIMISAHLNGIPLLFFALLSYIIGSIVYFLYS